MPSRSHTVTFQANEVSETLSLTTDDDDADEDDATVTATLVAATDGSYQLGSATTASVQVEDNDEPAAGPTISITRSASSVTEGGQVQFRLTSTQVAPTNGLSVNVNVSGGDAFLADTAPTAVQIAYNSDSATLTLPTSNDNVNESDDTVTVTVLTGAAM